MSIEAGREDNAARRRSTFRLLIIAAVVIVSVLLVANAHLVYVAFTSQPDCVTHLKGVGTDGAYRAAKSGC